MALLEHRKKNHRLVYPLVVSLNFLDLIKIVTKSMPFRWHSIEYIPVSTLENIKKKSFGFIWKGKKENEGFTLSKWERLAKSKSFGVYFRNLSAAKNLCRLIRHSVLSQEVTRINYIEPLCVEN